MMRYSKPLYTYWEVTKALHPYMEHTHMQVLVKKSYGDKRRRHKQRNWQLQQLDKEMDVSMETRQEGYEQDYTEFLDDLEEDKLFRKNVNIYFSK